MVHTPVHELDHALIVRFCKKDAVCILSIMEYAAVCLGNQGDSPPHALVFFLDKHRFEQDSLIVKMLQDHPADNFMKVTDD